MRTVIHDFDEVLHAPLVLASNTRLERARIRLAPDFNPVVAGQPNDWGAVRTLTGARNVEIDGAEIVGLTDDQWHEKKARGEYVWPIRGVMLSDVRDFTLSRSRIRGFSAEGLFTQDFRGLSILDSEVADCWAGVSFDWPRRQPNLGLLIDGLRIWDTRALDAEMMPMGGSVLYGGARLVGASGLHAIGLRGATIRRLAVLGEAKGGAKITNSLFVTVEDCRLPSLWLGGYDAPPLPGWGEQYRGPAASAGTVVRRCVIGESAWGVSRERSSDSAALHCSYGTSDETRLEDCTIVAPRPGPFYAPWWGDQAAPNFDRFEAVQANLGYRLVTSGLRVVDQFPEASAPRFVADAQSSIRHETPPVIDRVPARWQA